MIKCGDQKGSGSGAKEAVLAALNLVIYGFVSINEIIKKYKRIGDEEIIIHHPKNND